MSVIQYITSIYIHYNLEQGIVHDIPYSFI